jgi:hypothetical protein
MAAEYASSRNHWQLVKERLATRSGSNRLQQRQWPNALHVFLLGASMTPYGKYVTDRKTISIESAKERKRERDRLQQGGDNFRFVRWGGLGDLSLWNKR